MGYAFSNCSEQLANSSKLSPRFSFSSYGMFQFSVVGGSSFTYQLCTAKQ